MHGETIEMSFWLIPSSPAREELSRLIKQLADLYGSPIFEPHVTVHAGRIMPGQVEVAVKGSLSTTGPVSLQSSGLQHSNLFTKTLYIRFLPSVVVEALSRYFRSVAPSAYEFAPHLSLMYKTLSSSQRREIASRIDIKKYHSVQFDAIEAVHTPGSVKTAEDVRRWRTVARTSLR